MTELLVQEYGWLQTASSELAHFRRDARAEAARSHFESPLQSERGNPEGGIAQFNL
jgi:hypothetical protein